MKPYLLIAFLLAAACARGDAPAITTDSALTAGEVEPGRSADTTQVSTRDCGVTGTPVLNDNGIAELKHGRTVAEISARCEVLSDSEQLGQEGMMERILVVSVAGEPVRSVIVDDRIFRIEVNTPRFRTADSLGVDTPLRKIASMRGAQFAPGENGVYGFSQDHCGLSFRFSLPWRPPRGGQWTAQAIAAAHGDAAVNRVIVIECRR